MLLGGIKDLRPNGDKLPDFSFIPVTSTICAPDGGTVLPMLDATPRNSSVPLLPKIPYVHRSFKLKDLVAKDSIMLMVTQRIIIPEQQEAR